MKTHAVLAVLGLWCAVASGAAVSRAASNAPTSRPCEPQRRVTYTAAALEFEPASDGDPSERVLANTLTILTHARLAKEKGADIFVAPEYGLTSLEMNESMALPVPAPSEGAVPCERDDGGVLYELSCAARDLQMYLVVDLPERAGEDTLYNIQVAFDRQGTVVARYRKQHLFVEPMFTPGPADDDSAMFTTDFGVTFSLHICFDIVFSHPSIYNIQNKGVHDVIMSTAWVDVLPFFNAINVHNGFSRFLQTNLIVSGYHFPEKTKLGSGVYRGFSDLKHVYSYDADGGDALVVSTVDSCMSELATVTPPVLIEEPQVIQLEASPAPRKHLMLREDLSSYARVSLPPSEEGASVTACHDDGLCCTAEYRHQSDLNYQLLAYSGLTEKGHGAVAVYIQLCSIVWCENDRWTSCGAIDLYQPPADLFGPFTLSGTFTSSVVYPSVITRNLTLTPNDQIDFEIDGNVAAISAKESVNNVLTVDLLGRIFEKDPPIETLWESFMTFVSNLF